MTSLETSPVTAPTPSVVRLAYTPSQAAVVVNRTRTRIFKAIKEGELTARKDGKATLIEHGELERWLRGLPFRSAAAA